MAESHEEQKYQVPIDERLTGDEYPKVSPENKSYMAQALTEEVWSSLKDHVTVNGWTLRRAINTGFVNEDSLVGCHAGDMESYADFAALFDQVIEKYHGGYTPDKVHVTDLDSGKLEGEFNKTDNIRSTRIRVARNLYGFPLNTCGTEESRLAIEELMRQVLSGLEGDLAGTYYSLASLSPEERQQLVDDHFLFKPGDRFQVASGYHEHWPAGRGIFHNNDKTFLLWLNEGDHIRIISMQQGGDVKGVFERLCRGVKAIEEGIKAITGKDEAFMCNEHLGMITCCPSNLGTGLRGGVHITLPNLFSSMGLKQLDQLARSLGCQVRGTHGEHTEIVDTCDISNFHRIGRPEYELVQNMIDTVNKLNQLEDEAAAANASEAAAAEPVAAAEE